MVVNYVNTIAYYAGIMAYAQICLLQQMCLLQQRCWHNSLSATEMNKCQDLLTYYVAQHCATYMLNNS